MAQESLINIKLEELHVLSIIDFVIIISYVLGSLEACLAIISN